MDKTSSKKPATSNAKRTVGIADNTFNMPQDVSFNSQYDFLKIKKQIELATKKINEVTKDS